MVALSWGHGQPAPLLQITRVTAGATANQALVLAFGLFGSTDLSGLRPVVIGPASLDEHTLEAYLLQPLAPLGILTTEAYARIAPRDAQGQVLLEVLPVQIRGIDASGQRVTAATEVPHDGTTEANGAAIAFSPAAAEALKGHELFVQLRGDHIMDAERRAIDPNFLGSSLPSGDRLPGGTFWSWFTCLA